MIRLKCPKHGATPMDYGWTIYTFRCWNYSCCINDTVLLKSSANLKKAVINWNTAVMYKVL